MSNEVSLMNPIQREQDDDDWETADLSNTARKNQGSSRPAVGGTAASLRPSAPAFVPRPAAPSKPATGQPSRNNSGDDEWFGSRRPVSNRQIWESANNSAPPTVIAPSAVHIDAGTIGTHMPPAPVMQILRRPADSTGNTGRRSTPGTGTKTLERREEEYRLARERIFGPPTGSNEPGQAASSGTHSANRSRSGTPTGGRSKAGSPQPGFIGDSGYGGPHTTGRLSGPGERKTSSPGIMRQPKGPSAGGGFGR
ncbi:hypothetical protein BD324DRAFT_647797 [Kockovaella imperatae]|uniref:SUZ domain-containing protein n=1 Tax=Kockovaella imperatae TaxID=4999 RepID=A0A1Y1US88_9TREE|nr:hypothetical protein BD324DRAFT_647797 [Kockovaella imperatae]ORX40893.1 hypothetical protein BD324DRAFT_647797 [Kockovaella imperatae]